MTTWFTFLKNCRLLLAFFLLPLLTSAQTKPYFQQEVNSKIKVTLDDQEQTLTGDIEIEYINHSPMHCPKSGCTCGVMRSRTGARALPDNN